MNKLKSLFGFVLGQNTTHYLIVHIILAKVTCLVKDLAKIWFVVGTLELASDVQTGRHFLTITFLDSEDPKIYISYEESNY